MSVHPTTEMKFCRRCGTLLSQQGNTHVFVCEQGHAIYANASPAVGIIFYNDKSEIILLERAIDPGKDQFDIPGGFCDGAESLEEAAAREAKEEIGVSLEQYEPIEFLMSEIDPYEYRDETLSVLSVIFKARLKGEVVPVADDDAASATFIRLQDIDMERVYFPSVRRALLKLREEEQDKA